MQKRTRTQSSADLLLSLGDLTAAMCFALNTPARLKQMRIESIHRPSSPNRSQGATYTDTSFYRSKRWRSLRAHKLSINPYCECNDCKGKHIPADMVDHIHRIEDGGAPLDINNLQSMRNHPCHDRKRANEKNNKHNTK